MTDFKKIIWILSAITMYTLVLASEINDKLNGDELIFAHVVCFILGCSLWSLQNCYDEMKNVCFLNLVISTWEYYD